MTLGVVGLAVLCLLAYVYVDIFGLTWWDDE